MAWCEDHEAQNLETVNTRAKIVESLENIGDEKIQRNYEGRIPEARSPTQLEGSTLNNSRFHVS